MDIKTLTQGISDVLAMGNDVFLVIERSYIVYNEPSKSLTVSRVFKVDLSKKSPECRNLCHDPLSFFNDILCPMDVNKPLKKTPFLNFLNC